MDGKTCTAAEEHSSVIINYTGIITIFGNTGKILNIYRLQPGCNSPYYGIT